MKKKTTTTQNQQYSSSYGWQHTPINAQMQNVIDLANEPASARFDPSTFHRYAAMESDLERSYMDPFGAATSPGVREKALRSGKLKLKAERDKALRESYHAAEGDQFARAVTAASLTAPQLVQTGGTASGTQQTVQPSNLLGSIIGGAATVGSAAL